MPGGERANSFVISLLSHLSFVGILVSLYNGACEADEGCPLFVVSFYDTQVEVDATIYMLFTIISLLNHAHGKWGGCVP